MIDIPEFDRVRFFSIEDARRSSTSRRPNCSTGWKREVVPDLIVQR